MPGSGFAEDRLPVLLVVDALAEDLAGDTSQRHALLRGADLHGGARHAVDERRRSSWASVRAPFSRMRSSPAAPSRPIPVSSAPAIVPEKKSASESNSTSTEGRCPCTGSCSESMQVVPPPRRETVRCIPPGAR